MQNEELLTPQEVADELRVNKRTVYDLLRNNQLRHYDLGHRTKRIPREALNEYLAGVKSCS